MNKALFLDRDGVINDNTTFVNNVKQLRFIDSVFKFSKAAYDAGYKIFVITNQGGVAAGHLTIYDHGLIMRKVMDEFANKGCPISDYYSCMHLPPDHLGLVTAPPNRIIRNLIMDCDCRKPKPGLILRAAEQHNIDLAQSIMVGDQQTDIDAANAAGVGKSFLFNQQEGIWPTI